MLVESYVLILSNVNCLRPDCRNILALCVNIIWSSVCPQAYLVHPAGSCIKNVSWHINLGLLFMNIPLDYVMVSLKVIG